MRRASLAGRPAVVGALAFLLVIVAGGCVKRTIRITSEPTGALVWLNDREIGRTPVDAEFVYYGTYDVRIVHEGYEPLLTSGKAKPPLWDNVGPDLVAEVLPAEFESEVHWHYVLEPTIADPEILATEMLERARGLRGVLHADDHDDAEAGVEGSGEGVDADGPGNGESGSPNGG